MERVSELSTATAVVQVLFKDPSGKGNACYPVRNSVFGVGRSAEVVHRIKIKDLFSFYLSSNWNEAALQVNAHC